MALPEAEAKRVVVKLTAAVVAQELPLLLVLPQGEAQVGLLGLEVSARSPPEEWEDHL